MKLQAKKTIKEKFTIPRLEIEIEIYHVSAIKVRQYSEIFTSDELQDNVGKQLTAFTDIILDNTNLDNTNEELQDILTSDEIIELGSRIVGFEDKKENFTGNQ